MVPSSQKELKSFSEVLDSTFKAKQGLLVPSGPLTSISPGREKEKQEKEKREKAERERIEKEKRDKERQEKEKRDKFEKEKRDEGTQITKIPASPPLRIPKKEQKMKFSEGLKMELSPLDPRIEIFTKNREEFAQPKILWVC
jgi:sortase (surface protein transpeptidase)